jgi:hypothetical protein
MILRANEHALASNQKQVFTLGSRSFFQQLLLGIFHSNWSVTGQ